MKSALCLCFLACLLAGVDCRSTGAPNEACAAVSPDAGSHGAQPQTSAVPYMITGLPASLNYTPEADYNLTVTGLASEMFRGALVVALNSAGDRVGSFTPLDSNSQLACTDERGITHTDATDKTDVSFTWTAPPEGTGDVEIRFAVVEVQMTYWANQLAATLTGSNSAYTSLPGTLVTLLFAVLGLSLMVGF